MKISTYLGGRNNNLNLVRMAAAMAVLVSHSYALLGLPEPFGQQFGMTLGSVAVDIFFVASGFLITGSLVKCQNGTEFFWARVLRVYPGLLVVLLLTVLVLGPFFTLIPVDEYLLHEGTLRYFYKCLTLITGVSYELPWVFADNPFPGAVNGSLWTLPAEIQMYFTWLSLWILLGILRLQRTSFVYAFIVIGTLVLAALVLYGKFHGVLPYAHIIKLYLMFFIGGLFFVCRDRIVLSVWVFLGLVVLCILASWHKGLLFVVYLCAIGYLLFYIAYVPSGVIRGYNRLGDYSYGVYIYAFPVQQSLVALVPDIGVWQMIFGAAMISLVFAVLSWHLVEEPSLGLKSRCVGATRALVSLVRSGLGTSKAS